MFHVEQFVLTNVYVYYGVVATNLYVCNKAFPEGKGQLA
jgi:hypothetical protein